MLLLIHGEETFLSRQKVREIISHFYARYPQGLNFFRIDAAISSFDEIRDIIGARSLFRGRIFCVLENVFHNKILAESLLKEFIARPDAYALSSSPCVVLLFEDHRVGKDPLAEHIAAHGRVQLCNALAPERFRAHAKKMAQKRNLSFTPRAFEHFLWCTGQDLWKAEHELAKLASWSKQRGANVIDENDTKIFLQETVSSTVFNLVDALMDRDGKKSLLLWRTLTEKGEDPLGLLAMFTKHVKTLLAARSLIDRGEKSQRIVGALGVHPFVARKAFFQAKLFTAKHLAKLYEQLFWLDIYVKRGVSGIDEGFERVVLNVL